MDNRKRVLNYIEDLCVEPLHFNLEESELKFLKGCKKYYDSVVLNILILAREHYSYDHNNDLQTEEDRYRSSLDIWRHVKYYFPDITIFQVMNSLYRLRDDLFGQYCDYVERRVFKAFYDEEEKEEGSYDLLSTDEEDEYGLTFDDWEDIC